MDEDGTISSKKYRVIHRDRINAYSRRYRSENRERMLMLSRAWMHNKRLVAITKIAKVHRTTICCMRCGVSDLRTLQIDHINGGGTRELRLANHNSVLNAILASSEEKVRGQYQILCANCNMIKKEENRENYLWKEVPS